jgi:outer membrane protein, multidrug efflux system
MTPARLTLLISLAATLAACSVGPDYHAAKPGELGVPDTYSVGGPASPRTDLTAWWSTFDDPLLAKLVASAKEQNLDVGQAVARLREAREALVISRAGLLPSLGASGGYSHSATLRGGTTTFTDPVTGTVSSVSSGARDSFSVGVDASYQVGIFGEVRRTVEATRAQYAAAGYDYASVLVSSEAEIARNYVLARLYQAQLANARASLAIEDDNFTIAGFRVKAGLVSSLDAEQARAQRAQTAATIPTLDQNYNAAVARLGVLTGQAPGALKADLAAVQPIPKGPPAVAFGIPADTLRQRPDVRASERNLAAATAQIGVAKAALYPALAISGSLDTDAASLGSLTNLVTGQLFAGLTQSIFNGGRLHAQVRSNEAAAEGAFLSYKSTVLTALEDVENAIVALQAAKQRQVDFAEAYDAANNSAILSRSQYRAGLTDFTTLNTSESALLSARNGLSQAQADEATALIQLYSALGGGWASDTIPTAPADRPAPPTSQPAQDR